ncbi:MAG: hypothetical protein Q7R49_01905 [Candidatus Daviesbacteria bacterium]|nr:hypothetical protein [Candidatus Daviesbacteria bacterium]
MLESLGITNIGSLNLDEPRKRLDLPFDAHRDFDPIRFEEIMNSLKVPKNKSDNYTLFLALGKEFLTLFPEKRADFNWNFKGTPLAKEEQVMQFETNLLDFSTGGKSHINGEFWIERVCSFRAIEPETANALLYAMDSTPVGQMYTFGDAVASLHTYLAEKEDPIMLYNAMGIGVDLLLCGKDFYERYGAREFNSELWEFISGTLETARKTNQTEIFPELRADTRILYPEHFASVKLRDNEWPNIIRGFKSTPDTFDYTGYAGYLQILAAESVEVTDKGFLITMPKVEQPLLKEIPALPETRKF